ncbi:hypothetical protein [Terrabacter sp. 2YAF2]|uniref:hypothetical protein n=1 Tax=Terrabacter sp. 2YAF2 TaxID=3233026 RepID=UPI003F9E01F9
MGTELLLLAYVLTACAARAPATAVPFHEGLVTTVDSTTITLSVDACQRQPHDSRVFESAKEVRVTLSAIPPPDDASPGCSDLVVVRLSKPMGDRVLVDASTGRQVHLIQSGADAKN